MSSYTAHKGHCPTKTKTLTHADKFKASWSYVAKIYSLFYVTCAVGAAAVATYGMAVY